MRTNGWDVALIEWATGLIDQPFEWGRTDCTVLVAEAIDLITGVQACAQRYRGAWSDMESAVSWSRAHELDLLQGCEQAGCVEVGSLRMLQRGDILLVPFMRFDDVQVWCGHVVIGDQALSSSPERGVHWMPVRAICTRFPEVIALRVGA